MHRSDLLQMKHQPQSPLLHRIFTSPIESASTDEREEKEPCVDTDSLLLSVDQEVTAMAVMNTAEMIFFILKKFKVNILLIILILP